MLSETSVIYLAITLALIILPFVFGNLFASRLRMPDYGWKIGLILFTFFVSVALLTTKWPPKLGIDLSGGMILVYEIDKEKTKDLAQVDMDKLIKSIKKRVDPSGIKETSIRRYGANQIEIIIPQVEDKEEATRIKDTVSQSGTLEFRILANPRHHASIIERAKADMSKDKYYNSKGELQAWWSPIAPDEVSAFVNSRDCLVREKKRGNKTVLEALLAKDPYEVTGGQLSRVAADVDMHDTHRPCVAFEFNSAGSQAFATLTEVYQPQADFKSRLAIVLNDEIFSAPSINGVIAGRGQITSGSFTEQSVNALVDVLNAGALPAALVKEPISQMFSGPTLGRDTIAKSSHAMIISAILVPLFMLVYYRFSGVVATIALILNMLILIAIMVAFKARFTLPGLAGLALTVGMAVDNNVLVYERMREELAKGAALRMAIRNAFQRAGATIIDCNITHLIAAVVLYVIGTDQIKGFAITLLIGVIASMYTAVFVAHVIFDLAERNQWITKLKMMHLIGHTNFDFMKMFPYCLTFSIVISALGIAAAVFRGQGLFDIDFTGGTSVQVLFTEAQDANDIRAKLETKLSDLSLHEAKVSGDKDNVRFVIDTSELDAAKVRATIQETYGKKLFTNSAKINSMKTIDAKSTAEGANDAAPKTDKPTADPAKKTGSWLPTRSLRTAVLVAPLLFGAADADAATGTASPAALTSVASTAATTATGSAADVAAASPVVEKDPFIGGTEAEVEFGLPIERETVLDRVQRAVKDSKAMTGEATIDAEGVQGSFTEGSTKLATKWTVKINLPQDKAKTVLETVNAELVSEPYFPASNAIGGAVAVSTRYQAVWALVASWALIILYLWIRFQGVAFGFAAVVALVHDVLVMLGAIAFSYWLAKIPGVSQYLLIEQFKINLPIIAAFLTIIGYSVNDTIVVFDRIREVRGKDPDLTRVMVNLSTNQTLSRTLLTSLTVIIVVVVLYWFGGQALRGFSFALTAGVLTGTYSSIYVAAPILLWLVGKHEGTKKIKNN